MLQNKADMLYADAEKLINDLYKESDLCELDVLKLGQI